jgi:predicted O-methyltransferase YrrM
MVSKKQESSLDRVIRSLREDDFRVFLRRAWVFFQWRIIDFLVLYPYARWKLSREALKVQTPEAAVKFAFDRFGHLIRPMQYRWEITELAKLVQSMKPRVVLEVGTAHGGTLFVFSRFAAHDATIISIDQPVGYPKWREPLYKEFAGPGQQIHLIRADSHEEEAVLALSNILNGRKIDFLFIDADHSYDGVKRDYELYSPFVREGGVMAFHDIKYPAGSRLVELFWEEVKKKRKTQELIESPNQVYAGIGIIFK